MDPTSQSPALTNTESFTPSVRPTVATTTLAHTDESSQGDNLRSEASNSSLKEKGKNSIRTHFSSLRKSAKKLFKHKSKSQEFERDSEDPAPGAPRAASETYRTMASTGFANEESNERYKVASDYPSGSGGTSNPNNPTHATLRDSSQVDSDYAHQALNPVLGPNHTSFTMRPAPLTPSDSLPQTEIIQEIPSLIVFTPPALPPTRRASSPPRDLRVSSTTPSQPRSTRPILPSAQSPATKTKNAEFNLEAALKDIASQAVRFPPPTNRSPYLDGAVISLKFLVFAVASVGICVVALPGKCIGLLGIPSKSKSASQYLITDSTHGSKPTETRGDKSDLRKNDA